MTEEAYVSFENAKLLKEDGFDGECLSMYVTPKPHSGMGNPNEAKLAPHGRDSHYYEGYLYQCEAPTQQMAMRWLREVYNISIEISSFWNGSDDDAYKFSKYTYGFRVDTPNFTDRYRKYEFDTYEEAVETAIKYCLENLI